VNSVRLLVKIGFWLAGAVALAVALGPAVEGPQLGSDKVMHFACFAGLTCLAVWAYGLRRPWLMGVLLSAFGALIEVLQGLPLFGRDADVFDWIADTAAVALVLLAARLAAARLTLRTRS
jgi:hypothetical protein